MIRRSRRRLSTGGVLAAAVSNAGGLGLLGGGNGHPEWLEPELRILADGTGQPLVNPCFFPGQPGAPLNLTDRFAIRAADLEKPVAVRPGAHFGDRAGRGVQRAAGVFRFFRSIRELTMSSTFDTIANIIAETCDIPREQITPESHAINDLGIDSLDFLEIAFAIDKAFGIKMPLEQWTQEVNEGKVSTDEYFVLGNLCANIDKLVAAKAA